jgi:hypothetical protein
MLQNRDKPPPAAASAAAGGRYFLSNFSAAELMQ